MNKRMLNEWRPRFAEVIAQAGYEMLDVEFVHEGADAVLRFFIYSDQGITIDDCEVVSNMLSPKLDEWDPIDQHYLLEVSSPDLSRPLMTDRQLELHLGDRLEITLYQKKNGTKHLVGVLSGFDDQVITFDFGHETESLARESIAQIKPYLEF